MSGVSSDLLWLLVKKHNKFLFKQGGGTTRQVQFTSEPNNLMNKNTFKYSGLANPKSVGIQEDGDHVVVRTTNPKKGGQPAKHVSSSVHKKDNRKVAKAVHATVVGSGFRPDLEKAARSRVSHIHKALRVKKADGKKPRADKKKRALTTS
eukprot:TRINITY_DN1285_c0_g1_i1.p2 TRINITY_DN1285_c0_g1~~TRINITY_DN1285_c0_g1_i1.p2  ORF type:complete len:166 (-),score=52.14 TRINITY_DN1285_c0_g1_i1:158-607(-)